jgi:hypothetical protein
MKQQSTRDGSVFVSGMVRRAVLPAALLLGGCSADPVDLGDGRLGIDRNALESYAAVWEGYVEAYEFGSGSDRVRLVLDEHGDGTITFGVGEPLPEPTDPDAAFPFERFFDASGGVNIPTPVEGSPYVVAQALVEDERLRATLPTDHIYDSACAIQTPVAVNHERDQEFAPLGESGSGALFPRAGVPYACVAELGYNFNADGACFMGTSRTPISCTRAQLCNLQCECSATACAPRPSESELRLDAALNDAGDRLEGTLLGLEGSGGRATVRLTRNAAP